MRRAVERRIAVFGGFGNFSRAPARYDQRELVSTEGERRLFRVRVPAGHVAGQTLKVELPDSVKAFYEAE